MYERNIRGAQTIGSPLYAPSAYSVSKCVVHNIIGTSYKDNEDTNEFFLFAVGDVANLGLEILKEARPLSLGSFYEDWGVDTKEPVALWSFASEDQVEVVRLALTWGTHAGHLFSLHFDRQELEAAA